MSDRFTYGMQPTEAIRQLNGLDDDVAAAKAAGVATSGAAATSASLSAGSAAAAAAARDAAIAAWQASTAPTEQLAAISKQFHSGSVVDVFLYDTSRDSDGGAWRKRCKHTSWENETLVSGKYVGIYATTGDASVAGAVIGDYYQSSTLTGRFFMLTAQGGAEVYRGNTREFPALALIVAETGRVVIYDATQPSLPMWMVILSGNTAYAIGTALAITSLTAINGALLIGTAGALHRIEFLKDASFRNNVDAPSTTVMRGLAQRNNAANVRVPSGEPFIINATVNDVAATVLPDAPIDPATGLPVPTIAVATAAGMSVIKQDGTVASDTTAHNVTKIDISGTALFSLVAYGNSYIAVRRNFNQRSGTAADLFGLTSGGDAFYEKVTIPAIYPVLPTSSFSGPMVAGRALGHSLGLGLLKENPTTPVKGMVAYLTNAYNSGWQVGDIRGAWLADTVVETSVGSGELITNGTFTTDTSGWSSGVAGISSTAAVVSGEMQVTATSASGRQITSFPTVIGKKYLVSGDARLISGAGSAYIVQVGPGGGDITYGPQTTTSTAQRQQLTFTATDVISYIACSCTTNGSVGGFDNISVKLADPDRSMKGKGLVINGSITKTPVAVGAQLVGYSGFSAANYLEQPYNSDLDFGTGDFCVMGWVKGGYGAVFSRGDLAQAGSAFTLFTTAGTLYSHMGATGLAVAITANGAVPTSGWSLIILKRVAGVLSAHVNGVQVGTVNNTVNLTNTAAVSRVGLLTDNGNVGGSVALVRISATAPSADQIAQIYRDELPLFQANALCTFDGTSSAVTALAYDEVTDLLHVGTSWGRSAFHGLQRVESAATQVGAITALAAGQGAHITAGATSARHVQPALVLRDELRRREDARRAMAREEIPIDFDGIAAQTAFTLPLGFSVKGVLVAGAKKRLGVTKDYTISDDGYRQTVNFGVSPGAAWVQITVNRSM